MKVDTYVEFGVQPRSSTRSWAIKPYLNPSQQSFCTSTWVRLLELPSSYCSDEALLLCHEAGDLWLAWIPGHGEAVLHSSQFCKT
ncbi:MAG TPA: hypothetical protein V6D03_08355 [Candidatus Caenarcaniphilales bacterium]